MKHCLETQKETKLRVKSEIKDRSEEINRMLQHGHVLIQEKSKVLHGLKKTIHQSQEHTNKVMEMKGMGKREAEFEYKKELQDRTDQQDEEMRNLKMQFEHVYKEHEQKLKEF
jgi:hypothetical protein